MTPKKSWILIRRTSLLYFDCKFVADLGGDKVRKFSHRPEKSSEASARRSPINYIFSVSDYKNRSAFDDIFADLRGNEGIAIDESSEPDDVEAFSKRKMQKCLVRERYLRGRR